MKLKLRRFVRKVFGRRRIEREGRILTKAELQKSFAQSFTRSELDADFLHRFYCRLTKLNGLGDVLITAGDELCRDLGICNEDLDDTGVDLINYFGRKRPSKEQLKNHKAVLTVEDLALFIAQLPVDPEATR